MPGLLGVNTTPDHAEIVRPFRLTDGTCVRLLNAGLRP
jgi:hypothetical protein